MQASWPKWTRCDDVQGNLNQVQRYKSSDGGQQIDNYYDHGSSAPVYSHDNSIAQSYSFAHKCPLKPDNSFTMKKSFTVLICGVGVSGLSLALMLERLEIDYLVLEAYPEVTANVGAAVVLLPNGLRILNQLGVYDPFKEQYDQGPVMDTKFFSPEGQVLGTFEMNELLRWYVHNQNWLVFIVVAQRRVQDRISDDLPLASLLYGDPVQAHQAQGQNPGE